MRRRGPPAMQVRASARLRSLAAPLPADIAVPWRRDRSVPVPGSRSRLPASRVPRPDVPNRCPLPGRQDGCVGRAGVRGSLRLAHDFSSVFTVAPLPRDPDECDGGAPPAMPVRASARLRSFAAPLPADIAVPWRRDRSRSRFPGPGPDFPTFRVPMSRLPDRPPARPPDCPIARDVPAPVGFWPPIPIDPVAAPWTAPDGAGIDARATRRGEARRPPSCNGTLDLRAHRLRRRR
jgi:hypothetical protein